MLTVQSGEPLWLFVGLPFTLFIWAVGRFAPLGYRLAADGVQVERRVGIKVIPYGAIRGVDRLPRPIKGLSVTGSKGIFGYFGGFWNSSLGFYRLFLTNQDNIVWLDTRAGWVALSPDRPDEFVERLRPHLR